MALSVGSSDDNWNSEFDRDRPVSAEQWMAHSPAGVGSCPVYRNLDRRDGTFAIRSPGSRVRDHDGVASRVSGTLFMLVQGPAFIKLYAFAALFSTLYLGGYLGPAIIPPIVWCFLKTIVIIVAIMLFRSTFPRVRLDQLLRQGWTTLLTLSIVNIVIAYFIVVGVPAI